MRDRGPLLEAGVVKICVINPNSNRSVTAHMAVAIEKQFADSDVEINCTTLQEGPFGIETEQDIEAVIPLLLDHVTSCNECDAFVIACYSDPGLAQCRSATRKPVFGIHESAVRQAASAGTRFGVLALGNESIQRHVAYVRELGLQDFHAGERALGVSVDEAANDAGTLDKIVAAGRGLIDDDGAQVLILGCAGMAAHRRSAELALGVRVIDPTEAAVREALNN